MKKTIPAIVVCLLFLLLLSACSDSAFRETGYPSGEVQNTFLFYNGQLWGPSVTVKELPAGYSDTARVISVNNRQKPTTELAAAHLEVGSAVYTDSKGTDVYVESGKVYILMKKYEVAQ